LFFARTIVKPQFLNKTFIINTITVIVLFFAVPIVFPQLNYFHYAQSEQTYFLNGEPDPDYKFSAIGGEMALLLLNKFLMHSIISFSDPI
jgi:hypothetical protein